MSQNQTKEPVIVTVAQQKGGAGKTTMALQLAVAWQKQGYKVIKWSLKDYTNERTNMYGGKIGTEERTMAQQLYVVDTNIGTCFSGQGVELDCAAVKRDQDLSGYIK
ncbi:MAG: hypothetical protein EBR02_10060 [Alphaproteobacteria bacterium]|nr:hypothetical protein [Alphaproteobacteria bacterium]